MSKTLLVEDADAKVFYEINTGNILIHMEVHGEWNIRKYKEWKVIWSRLLTEFKVNGVKELFTLIPKQEYKVQKWQMMWGFKPMLEFADAILFRKEL